jgi:hypothetical protein
MSIQSKGVYAFHLIGFEPEDIRPVTESIFPGESCLICSASTEHVTLRNNSSILE